MAAMKVLVVGSGSREHALVRRLVVEGNTVLCAPGNGGTARDGTNVPVKADDVAGLVGLATAERVDLVVVGPEVPLTLGLVDALAEAKIAAFGPTKAAARLEGSKVFMKQFLKRHGIPTAGFEVFDDPDAAERYVRDANRPLVVKTDGLAAGKGVVVASSTEEALGAVRAAMREGAFGEAGRTVVIEELLPGEEASFHVICDGERGIALASAQDHKHIFDGDRGPNTGGMGAYAPAPVVTDDVHARVMREVVEPTLAAMRAEGTPFRGVLFVGLMIEAGVPRVLEFNVRFGDPEACVVLPLYEGDFGALLQNATSGNLPTSAPVAKGAALCVVMAAEGYPAKVTTGDVIHGLDHTHAGTEFVLHAGSALRDDGSIVTSGGRVLTVGAAASTLSEARLEAYAAVARIRWRGEQHRTDIGWRALATNS